MTVSPMEPAFAYYVNGKTYAADFWQLSMVRKDGYWLH
jgi:hypothetical protein